MPNDSHSYPTPELLNRIMDAVTEVRSNLHSLQTDVSGVIQTQIEIKDDLSKVQVKVQSLSAVIPEALHVRLDRIEQDKQRQDRYLGAAVIAGIGALCTGLWNLLSKHP